MKDHLVAGEFEVPQQYIDREVHRLWGEIKLKYQQYRGICAPVSLRGKQVILVDDGIATGTSVLAAAQLISAVYSWKNYRGGSGCSSVNHRQTSTLCRGSGLLKNAIEFSRSWELLQGFQSGF